MSLKIAVVILFVLMVISLFIGSVFLFRDQGSPSRKRTFYLLVIRAALAVALFSTIAYGIASGKFRSQAPWDAHQRAAPQSSTPDN